MVIRMVSEVFFEKQLSLPIMLRSEIISDLFMVVEDGSGMCLNGEEVE